VDSEGRRAGDWVGLVGRADLASHYFRASLVALADPLVPAAPLVLAHPFHHDHQLARAVLQYLWHP
jgi:hypothetical protein